MAQYRKGQKKMDRDFLKKIIKEGVVKVFDEDNVKIFMRVSGQLDTNYITVMQDTKMDMHERLRTILCMVLCDPEGNHIYDYKNEDDKKLVAMMPDKYSIPLIDKLEELFQVDRDTEKKTSKGQG